MNQLLNFDQSCCRPIKQSQLTASMEMVSDIPPLLAKPDLSLRGYALIDEYRYATKDGKLVSIVARYERDGNKTFRQYTVWKTLEGEMNWYGKGLVKNRPLFQLPLLIQHFDSTVILAEGEKCALMAANAFTDYVCVTSMGGTGGIAKSDFTQLAGRDVIIMPDNDAPGEKASEQFTESLREVGAARIRVLNISKLAAKFVSADLQKGFDIADAIDSGYDAECLERDLKDSEMIIDVTSDHSQLSGDIVFRELYEIYQLVPKFPDEFELSDAGILKTVYDREGKPEIVFVGSPLAVIGRTHQVGGSGGWGYHVVLKTPDKKWVGVNLKGKLFASCGKELREILADAGFICPQSLNGRRALSELISYWKDCPIIEHATQLGWVGESFALPEEIIQPLGCEKNIMLSMHDQNHLVRKQGTFDGWLEIPFLAEQSSRATFAICTAFAAPLLRIFHMKGGGFHFSGQSSRGKTTIIKAAGSVWGGGGEDGFARTWTMTTNGAEGLVADHNDILLPLDELTKVSPDQAAEIIMLLANGQGKARARRDGTSAPAQMWRVLFLSTGERTISHQLELAGGKTHMTGGIGARVPDIPIEVSPGVSFENFKPFCDSGELVKKLVALSDSHYGHAGPRFIRYLIDKPTAIDSAKSNYAKQQRDLTSPDDDPQVERVADRFALVSAAGLLAIDAGVLPIKPDSVIHATERCFNDWKAQRGGNKSEEELAARQHLKYFFDVHGASRFEPLKCDKNNGGETEVLRDAHVPPVRDRCGYRTEEEDGAYKYFILAESWRTAVCGPHSTELVAKIAKDVGALELGEGGRNQKKVRLPDYPDGIRAYVLRPDKLGYTPETELTSGQ